VPLLLTIITSLPYGVQKSHAWFFGIDNKEPEPKENVLGEGVDTTEKIEEIYTHLQNVYSEGMSYFEKSQSKNTYRYAFFAMVLLDVLFLGYQYYCASSDAEFAADVLTNSKTSSYVDNWITTATEMVSNFGNAQRIGNLESLKAYAFDILKYKSLLSTNASMILVYAKIVSALH
jgi:hypothetical protein